jgi:hypothetical protein
MIVDAFKDEVEIVDQAGEGVLRVRTAIRGLQRGGYQLIESGAKAIKPDAKLAAATFEMEMIDAVSKERVVALVDNLFPAEKPGSKETAAYAIRDVFGDWVQMLKAAFASQKITSTIPD